jgi:hypothetical protein
MLVEGAEGRVSKAPVIPTEAGAQARAQWRDLLFPPGASRPEVQGPMSEVRGPYSRRYFRLPELPKL